MNLFLHLLISAFCVVIFYIYYDYLGKSHLISDPLLLVIGILSARQNFNLREQLRSSWLKPYKNNTFPIKAWFIIGKDDCKIPPAYRLTIYGCEKWNIVKPGIAENFHSSQVVNYGHCSFKNSFRQGFSFKVNHPVVVKKLGVLHHLLGKNTAINAAILDIQSKKILVQTTITENNSSLENGYLYEDIEALLLPKHYEGLVLVEGYLQTEACINVVWNDGGGVITFNRIYSTPSHLDSIPFKNDIFSAASIQFFIQDLDTLNNLITNEENVTAEWLSHINNINEKLSEESIINQDMLIVDVMDTYRNLPIKLLHFYKWVHHNYEFSFLMKTDDDTMINIEKVTKHMTSYSDFDSDKLWLWSLGKIGPLII